MKILIDLTSLADNFSGIERYALNISKQMIMQDNENKYILLFKNKIHSEFEQFVEKDNIEFKVIKGSNKLFFNQFILPFNLYRINADKYIFLAFPSPVLFYKRGIINTIHDLTCWDYPETMTSLSKWYFRISILVAVRVSERILTVSKFSRKRILDKFNLKKEVNIIYNGVSEVFENFKYEYEEEKSFSDSINLPDKYILALGTIEPRKNLKLLIQAYSDLKKEGLIEEKLVLVGRKGWKIEDILDDDSKYIEKDIIFTGFVDDKYLPYIYKKSKLFIFPSLYEGFGIPLLEAMYMETPTLVSDIEPFIEIGSKDMNVFKSNSREDLKNSIMSVDLSDNLIYKNKMQAEKFKWSTEANKLLKILLSEV